MKLRLLFFAVIITFFTGCHKSIEPQCVVGYIASVTEGELITLDIPDSLPAKRSFAIDDNTECRSWELCNGNIAEVIYMPSEVEGEMAHAINIKGDATYPRMLGRWRTKKDDKFQIDITLQPYGKVLQTQPTDIFSLNSWQLTGTDDVISLHGTLSLPPESESTDKKKKKSEEEMALPTQRRNMHFIVSATLADDDAGLTERGEVLIITTDKGRKSRLYPAE